MLEPSAREAGPLSTTRYRPRKGGSSKIDSRGSRRSRKPARVTGLSSEASDAARSSGCFNTYTPLHSQQKCSHTSPRPAASTSAVEAWRPLQRASWHEIPLPSPHVSACSTYPSAPLWYPSHNGRMHDPATLVPSVRPDYCGHFSSPSNGQYAGSFPQFHASA